MNTDFVILPAAKTGNSVKLKAKNMQALHMETIQLEKQNLEMEQKLNQLRESMSREKEEREQSSGYHWKSGQAGNVGSQNQNKENAGKVSSGRIKFRILKNESQEQEKPKTISKPANPIIAERPKVRGKACGQCEAKTALLMCVECGEDYCPACFARIHQKGALKLHRTLPVKGKSQANKLDVSQQQKKELNFDDSREKPDLYKNVKGNMVSAGTSSSIQKTSEVFYSIPTNSMDNSSGSLLHGTYNEEGSAKSFHDALIEWRKEAHSVQPKETALAFQSGCTGNSEAQTILTVVQKPIEVEFKENGISYMEKLMLKKHRRTPLNPVFNKLPDKCRYSPTSDHELNESEDLTAEEMEHHELFAELFKPEEHVKTDVMHEPALKIVELTEAQEDTLEESRYFLVSEVDEIIIQPGISLLQKASPAKSREINEKELEERIILPSSFPDTESSKNAKKSDTSPVRTAGTRRNVPLRSTYSVSRDNVKFAQGTSVTPAHVETTEASQLKDSKSMEYKSSNDNHSLDTAAVVNMSKELESIALRRKSGVSEYQGLQGFFTLDVNLKEVIPDHTPRQTIEHTAADEKLICACDNHWRPASSLCECADDSVVKLIVANAQSQYPSYFKERILSPRQPNKREMQSHHTVSHSGRSYSAKSVTWNCKTSRPSTTPRPVSRAASEISEIESIDTTDQNDQLMEDAEGKEALAVLEKELHALRSDSDTEKMQHQQISTELFPSVTNSKTLTEINGKMKIRDYKSKNSSPKHATDPLESCDGESESDDDKETLQDRLNVLSLQ
ncbi:zinc finger B-box domain-containing protein 1 [Discoglossus pictus]